MAQSAAMATLLPEKGTKVYGVRFFMKPGCPVDFFGGFRDNIRDFLDLCGGRRRSTGAGDTLWLTWLSEEISGDLIPLYTLEYSVRGSALPFCDHCQRNGWSHHLLSNKRYHFVIPMGDDEWDGTFRFDSHFALHGLLHCNGFGHLLSINGREGGCKHISGRVAMDLWDRLCTSLRAREVTVEDSAKKMSMHLRLLLGVAYGVPWFAPWGYCFNLGSSTVNLNEYSRALHRISSLPLRSLMARGADVACEGDLLCCIATAYSKQNPRLVTIRDLLRHLLELLNYSPPVPSYKQQPEQTSRMEEEKQKQCRDFREVAVKLARRLRRRWSEGRLMEAAEAIVAALLMHPGAALKRRQIRDVARGYIGDTGLLDSVLTYLADSIVGGHVVRRSVDPATRSFEFHVEEFTGAENLLEMEEEEVKPPEVRAVAEDLKCLYNGLIAAQPNEVQAVLNSKQWIKRWVHAVDEKKQALFPW